MKSFDNAFVRLAVILLSVFVLFGVGCSDSPDAKEVSDAIIPAPPAERMSKMQYGIIVDSMEVIQDKINRNQVFSRILAAHNVSMKEIDDITSKSKSVFDLRKLRAGNPFTILKSKDTDEVNYFVYEINKADYVVFDLRKGIEVYKKRKKVVTKRQTSAGTINSSLSMAVQKSGSSQTVALELARIFAWTIDFFHLKKGDAYKLIYDEEFVEGESIGISRIHTAWFQHRGKETYAIKFTQDGIEDFYDINGENIKKAFLKAPLKYSRISSKYSKRRFHPILKRYRPHLGVDYAAPRGTPIYAVGNGTVIKASYSRGNGRYVKIKHNKTYTTQYLHMSKFAKGMKKGKRVSQGDIIGYVGSTGLATGPHLCFRFWKNGKQVDPLKVIPPPAEPINDAHRAAFEVVRDQLKEELDALDPTEQVFASTMK